ncbi:AAA family ATPase [Dermabacteraceae bacterium TAE3-ERU5]|nr:AAA family ATPase [Dermabacteraceae bacterium TAE3-ERU5]
MHISEVKIENFRAHSSTFIPLTQLGCLIGENNSGKSSILHAIQFALEERSLHEEDFRDPLLQVKVTLKIEGITSQDLQRITNESHRTSVANIINDGTLTIFRRQAPKGKAESGYLKIGPKNPNWDLQKLSNAMKGKKGNECLDEAAKLIPEIRNKVTTFTTQKQIKEAFEELVEELPPTELAEVGASYPTGIANAITPLLPSIIYVEAVKDVSAEAKASGNSAFSKMLKLLFESVSDNFTDIANEFMSVYEKLNISLSEDGQKVDNRLDAVRKIESTIESFVQESFPGISLHMEVPAPSLSMLLAGATISIDDGHQGPVTNKGDGLKRTVLFALLRAYARIKDTGLGSEMNSDPSPYLLLFEEPELYLHPKAQKQLMGALEVFSHDHQVLVTTHSPSFFLPNTKGFIKLSKTKSGVSTLPVDLTLTNRDAYQIIQYENNEAAFFAQTVVLVEGDSDTFIYPHLAKVINPKWNNIDQNVMFTKINGKGNIKRYRNFFSKFNVPVHVITDLDSLTRGFDQLTDNAEIKAEHNKLMQLIDQYIQRTSDVKAKEIRKICGRGDAKELWTSAQQYLSDWIQAPQIDTAKNIKNTLHTLFDLGKKSNKTDQLTNPENPEITLAKISVISLLSKEHTYVLQRGSLENYYGSNATTDKITEAINFREKVSSIAEFRQVLGDNSDAIVGELSSIFTSIYDGPKSSA